MKNSFILPIMNKFIYSWRTFLFMCLVAGFAGCQSSPASVANQSEMAFSVDTMLVKRVIRDTALNVVYRLPEQWQDMTTDTALSSKVNLLRFAGDTAAKVMLSMVDIRSVPDSAFSQLKTGFRHILNGNGEWENVTMSDFTKDGFKVHQYVMTKAEKVHFRLVFFRGTQPLIQLDFQTPVGSAFTANTRILESIIGSLKNNA